MAPRLYLRVRAGNKSQKLTQRRLLDFNLGANSFGLTTANLTWTNNSGATSWEIEILPAAAIPTETGVVYKNNGKIENFYDYLDLKNQIK